MLSRMRYYRMEHQEYAEIRTNYPSQVPFRQDTPCVRGGGLLLPTNSTDASTSLSLNHYRLNWWYFNNLTSADHLLLHISQVSATVRAYFKFALYDNVGLCLETTLAHVSIPGAFFLPLPGGMLTVGFSIGRGKARRVGGFWDGGGQILLTSLASNSATLACNCRTKSIDSSRVRVSKCSLVMFLLYKREMELSRQKNKVNSYLCGIME